MPSAIIAPGTWQILHQCYLLATMIVPAEAALSLMGGAIKQVSGLIGG